MELRHVVIAGATGIVGIALVNKMIECNVKTTIILRTGSSREKNIPVTPLIQKVYCDIKELDQIDITELEPCDVFYYLAWEGAAFARNDVRCQLGNIQCLLDAIKLAGELGGTFVGVGSQAEYGVYNTQIQPESIPNPISAYGVAKMTAQKLGRIYAEQLGVPFIWTRIFSVYGPYDLDKTLVMSCIKALYEEEDFKLTKCEQLWDFLYAEDAAEAYYRIGISGKSGKIYNICNGEVRKLKDYIQEIEGNYKENYPSRALLLVGAREYDANQIMFQGGDISSLNQDTGFWPRIPFHEGIRRTIHWYIRRRQNEENKCVNSNI